jgi:hypothetical protein
VEQSTGTLATLLFHGVMVLPLYSAGYGIALRHVLVCGVELGGSLSCLLFDHYEFSHPWYAYKLIHENLMMLVYSAELTIDAER